MTYTSPAASTETLVGSAMPKPTVISCRGPHLEHAAVTGIGDEQISRGVDRQAHGTGEPGHEGFLTPDRVSATTRLLP